MKNEKERETPPKKRLFLILIQGLIHRGATDPLAGLIRMARLSDLGSKYHSFHLTLRSPFRYKVQSNEEQNLPTASLYLFKQRVDLRLLRVEGQVAHIKGSGYFQGFLVALQGRPVLAVPVGALRPTEVEHFCHSLALMSGGEKSASLFLGLFAA